MSNKEIILGQVVMMKEIALDYIERCKKNPKYPGQYYQEYIGQAKVLKSLEEFIKALPDRENNNSSEHL